MGGSGAIVAEMRALKRGERPKLEDDDCYATALVSEQICRRPRSGAAPPGAREISALAGFVIHIPFRRC